MQAFNERFVNPERRLSTGEDHHATRIGGDSIDELLITHQRALLMVRITEGTAQVAAGKADEYGRRPGVEPLTLQAIENLVNLSHR